MAISPRAARKREDLQRRILNEAREMVVTEGFESLSMRKLAEKSDCALGTLYLYFKNRDDLVRHLWIEGFGQLMVSLAPCADIADPAERMRKIGREYVAFGLTYTETYRILFMEDPKFSAGTTYSGGMPEGVVDPAAQAGALLLGLAADLRKAGLAPRDWSDSQVMETFWTSLHGIVSLQITCSLYLQTDAQTLSSGMVESLLRGWADVGPM